MPNKRRRKAKVKPVEQAPAAENVPQSEHTTQNTNENAIVEKEKQDEKEDWIVVEIDT
jgi:hypothetical protein